MKKISVVLSLLLFTFVSKAQVADGNPSAIGVKIWLAGTVSSAGAGHISITANALPNAYAPSGVFSASVTQNAGAVSTDKKMMRIEPGKVYDIAVNFANIAGASFCVKPPDGYRVNLNFQNRQRYSFDYETQTTSVRMEVVREYSDSIVRRAGEASSLVNGKIQWQVGLGATENGDSAGVLVLSNLGIADDWTGLINSALLSYTPRASNISVNYENLRIRQIVLRQAVVDVVTLADGQAFEIRFYAPSQVTGFVTSNSGELATFSGSPYMTYRVRQGDIPTSLEIVGETRDASGALVRSASTSLRRTGAYPSCQWVMLDWTTLGEKPLKRDLRTWTQPSSGRRTEVVNIASFDVSKNDYSTVADYSATREFLTYGWGEELVRESIGGSSNPIVRNYDYYENTSDFGSYGLLRSVSCNDRSWTAYEYAQVQDDDADIGIVRRKYRPFIDYPSAVPYDLTASGLMEITTYDYVKDPFGAKVRLASAETRVNGVLTAKSTTEYNDEFMADSLPLVRAIRRDYAGAATSYVTQLFYYREDIEDDFLRGKMHSVSRPDGSKTSYVYRMVGQYLIDAKAAVVEINGAAAPGSGADYFTSYWIDGMSAPIDPLYIIPNKSTVLETLHDRSGRVETVSSRVWNGQMWADLGATSYGYDRASHLTSRTGSNGSLYEAVYFGDQKTSECDEGGVSLSYQYDAAGRVSSVERAAADGVPATKTTYGYNALDRVRSEAVVGGSERIETTFFYDEAGREISRNAPGVGVISTAYETAARKVTVTNPDLGTKTSTFNPDGSLASITGSAVVSEYYTYAPTGMGMQTTKRLGSASSTRYTRQEKDMLGRLASFEQPGFSKSNQAVEVQSYVYDGTSGLLRWISSTSSPSKGFLYDSMGVLVRQGIDVDGDGQIAANSVDRVTDSDTAFKYIDSAWWRVTSEYAYYKNNSDTRNLVAQVSTKLTGLSGGQQCEKTMDAEGRVQVVVTNMDRASKTVSKVVSQTGLNDQTSLYRNGKLVSQTSADGRTTRYSYDTLGRLERSTDSRWAAGGAPEGLKGLVSYLANTALPYQAWDGGGRLVSTKSYGKAGRLAQEVDGTGNVARYAYNLQGLLVAQWGSAATPVSYEYNQYADRVKMTTYRNNDVNWNEDAFPANVTSNAVTVWDYDEASGLLYRKKDAAGHNVEFDYDGARRVSKRTWARGLSTSYKYTTTGELSDRTYSDGLTQAVHFTYTRAGQIETVSDSTGTRLGEYDPDKPWRLTKVSLSEYYGNRRLGYLYTDSGVVGLDKGFQLGTASDAMADARQVYGYSLQGRVSDITYAGRAFIYTYLEGTGLLKERSVQDSGLKVSYEYETNRDLLKGMASTWSGDSRSAFSYTYDAAGKRETALQTGSAFSDYGGSGATYQKLQYTSRGELADSFACLGTDVSSTSSPLPGRHFTYSYDAAGNRKSASRTGVEDTAEVYEADDLNRYTSKENNGLTVSGTAPSDSKILVRGASKLAAKQGGFWSDEIMVDNVSRPFYGDLTILGKGSGSSSIYTSVVKASLAKALQTFTYDEDGNMSSDGMWDFSYDGENQLVRLETTSLARAAGVPYRILEFTYDSSGRRVQKRVVDGSSGRDISRRRYLYNGWNVIAELDAAGGSAGAVKKRFVWGLDVTGSLTAAGGVGALLQIVDAEASMTLLATYDGTGNVSTLVDASSGAVKAAYEYSPFGEPLRCSGDYATQNPFRYSTKFTDDETGLVYFGRRFYSPRLGRFVCRDPLEEAGGINLYAYIRNAALNGWDYLGMAGSGFFACGWSQAFMDWSPFAQGTNSVRAQFKWDDGAYRGLSKYAQEREAAYDKMVNEAFNSPRSSDPEVAKYEAAGMRVEYGRIGKLSVLKYQDPLTGAWLLWGSDPNSTWSSLILGGPLIASSASGMFSDGAIPWVSTGGEAAASGRGVRIGVGGALVLGGVLAASGAIIVTTDVAPIIAPVTYGRSKSSFPVLKMIFGPQSSYAPPTTWDVKKMEPEPDAVGPHTTIKIGPNGEITNYQTWYPQTNPQNPTPWEPGPRVDVTGKPHDGIPTPHVHQPDGTVRPANPNEIPIP